jgi:putative transposase
MVIAVRETGEREVLGFAFGASEEQAFWLEFLRNPVRRGLKGVQFMRNLLAHVPRGDKAIAAAALGTIFAQPDRQAGAERLGAGALRGDLATHCS